MTTATAIPEALCADESISAYGTARSTIKGAPLSPDELRKIDAYWRASLYLSLGMLYLKDNPLLREALKVEHTKPRLLGHWGSDAGHVRGYKEQGNINTPLELAIRNQTDRFSLAIDAIDRMPRFRVTGSGVREALRNQQIACERHAYEFGLDQPEITNWKWPF